MTRHITHSTLIALLVALFSFALLTPGWADDPAPAVEAGTYYTCPMHADVKSDKPGKCPKCGMKLVEKKTVVYTCPMRADVTSDKPGKCPKCGMKLVEKKTAVYTCPMHADVKSDKPGKCPKCGMKLKEVKTDDAAE